jgi:site-specific recombinase XerD
LAGKKIVEVVQKYNEVSTHTARRSFATNMKRKGIDNKIIMAATGHKTEKSFNIYLKLDNQDYMDMLADHNAKK